MERTASNKEEEEEKNEKNQRRDGRKTNDRTENPLVAKILALEAMECFLYFSTL